MHKIQNTHRTIMLGLWALAVMGLMAGPALAGSLEPPASAVDASGNPVPTTTGQLQPIDDGDIRFVNPFDGRVVDHRTGLEWEQSPDVTSRNHADALAHCDGLGLGGQDDWRLPELDELVSLVDLDNPGGDPDLPPGHPFSNVQSAGYWSATSFADFPANAWGVGFLNGLMFAISKDDNLFVWCAR